MRQAGDRRHATAREAISGTEDAEGLDQTDDDRPRGRKQSGCPRFLADSRTVLTNDITRASLETMVTSAQKAGFLTDIPALDPLLPNL
jgi:hypothetical protein